MFVDVQNPREIKLANNDRSEICRRTIVRIRNGRIQSVQHKFCHHLVWAVAFTTGISGWENNIKDITLL